MKVAVLIPCFNEEASVAQVVTESRRFLPNAEIWVIDNASTDRTAELASSVGAKVLLSPLAGKGNAIRHGFRVIDADYYVMVDGDGTYPMREAPKLLELARTQNFEMVTGSRLQRARREAFRPFHFFGNRFFTGLVVLSFGFPVRDLLTGLRVFSRRYRNEVQLTSRGFELETEMTVRAIAQNMAFCEKDISYVERVSGSSSKLRTFKDGFKIFMTIASLLAFFRPRFFFGSLGILCWSIWALADARWAMPLAPLTAGFFLAAFVLDHQRRRESFRLRSVEDSSADPSSSGSKAA